MNSVRLSTVLGVREALGGRSGFDGFCTTIMVGDVGTLIQLIAVGDRPRHFDRLIVVLIPWIG